MSATVGTREDALAEIRRVARSRTDAQAEADAAYQRLLELFAEFYRRFDPPILQRELAEAAEMKMVTVNAAIKKYEHRHGNGD